MLLAHVEHTRICIIQNRHRSQSSSGFPLRVQSVAHHSARLTGVARHDLWSAARRCRPSQCGRRLKRHKGGIIVTNSSSHEAEQDDANIHAVLTAGCRAAASRARVHAADVRVQGWAADEGA
eukprot:3097694-Pyramimonas_sp.AAC.1